MKAIIKAMNETEFKPRAKWWGFVENGKRYLCRYHHVFACFDLKKKKVEWAKYETITDKRGVAFAVEYFQSLHKK
jgi:hypothetical protein